MAFQPFSHHSGPGLPPATQTLFGTSPQPPFLSNPFPYPPPPRQQSPRPSVSSCLRDPQLKTPLNDADSLTIKQPSPGANFVDPHDAGIRYPVPKATRSPSLLHTGEASFGSPHTAGYDSGRFPVQKMTGSPPFLHTAEGSFGSPRIANYNTGRLGLSKNVMFDNAISKTPLIMRSPPLSKAKHAVEEFHSEVSQRPLVSPPRWGNQPKVPATLPNSSTVKIATVAPFVHKQDIRPNFPAEATSFHAPKRMQSPSLPSTGEGTLGSFHLAQDDARRLRPQIDVLPNNEASKAPRGMWLPPALTFESYQSAEGHQCSITAQRPALSPPRWGHQQRSPVNVTDSLIPARSFPVLPHDAHDTGPMLPSKTNVVQVPKRTRSHPLPSSDEVVSSNSHYIQDDSEREAQAKARRLARFNIELSNTVQDTRGVAVQKPSGVKNDKSLEKHKFIVKHPIQESDLSNSGPLFDDEGAESSSIVVGLCPDMCPESERDERERKGDLDKYERVDGDRNQTSRGLAVKKYNRMAEREADLIRPLPVLQKTVDYLLSLLEQPYDDNFLGMYNFLWDRMRAIRMDLRMQHIFNWDAITMLEQMIRLHIIAMHELCEYTKGEGFAEGFDAHLNIEQMNKASVELFQLYDDHRKKGSSISTEKEFRGYYALLKLDKHPGYKVEPAELSLDLAKMTPEIRGAPEILFAREVARACRTGNFIAFFRLARKATYLQSCLMHAHFAKLRTQALACLHSALQNNQGIPVKEVVEWLAMEEEDIENVLEYHGFSIKRFKDAYMMKEGPFLNSEMDYPTKCSHLVHMKRSASIIDDVFSGQPFSWSREREVTVDRLDEHDKKDGGQSPVETETFVDTIDEDMLDFEDNSSPRIENNVQLVLETPNGPQGEYHSEMADLDFVTSDSLSYHQQPEDLGTVNKPSRDLMADSSRNKTIYSPSNVLFTQSAIARHLQNETPTVERETLKSVAEGNENEALVLCQRDEAATAKLRLMLRMWKQRSQRQREIREQRLSAANAALSLLSLGLPIHKSEVQVGHASDLNINHVVMERLGKHTKSWSTVNVSEEVMGILGEKNCSAKCICWKLIVSSQSNGIERQEMLKNQADDVSARWLHAKVMGAGNEDDDELAVSSPGLSIWKKWAYDCQACCLSVIRHISFDGNRPVGADDMVAGAGAIVFLVSEHIPWDFQRTRLHNLLSLLHPGSGLPLLILIGGVNHNQDPYLSHDVVNRLGLHGVDNKRIATFSVVDLTGNHASEDPNGFLSDDCLREGLQWLANQSPAQLVLREVEIRELVLGHLSYSLEVLNSMELSKVGPDQCISAFNDALDRSSEDIVATANLNSAHWPCPEINLLDEFSDERRAANLFLPSNGWSSAERIESTVRTIKGCSLPYFATDLSWLSQGSDTGKDILDQKLNLEKCLTWYLVEASKMMGEELAAREAYVMLQKGAGVEVDGLRCRIVPRWTDIFRRVFNWRIMNLREGPFSRAYIAEHSSRPGRSLIPGENVFTVMNGGMNESDTRLDTPTHRIHSNLSLDEMIEISCQHPFGPPPSTKSGKKVDEEVQERTTLERPEDVQVGHSPLAFGKKNETNVGVISKTQETDKLSMLLEHCNMLQDEIDEKLAVYF